MQFILKRITKCLINKKSWYYPGRSNLSLAKTNDNLVAPNYTDDAITALLHLTEHSPGHVSAQSKNDNIEWIDNTMTALLHLEKQSEISNAFHSANTYTGKRVSKCATIQ